MLIFKTCAYLRNCTELAYFSFNKLYLKLEETVYTIGSNRGGTAPSPQWAVEPCKEVVAVQEKNGQGR